MAKTIKREDALSLQDVKGMVDIVGSGYSIIDRIMNPDKEPIDPNEPWARPQPEQWKDWLNFGLQPGESPYDIPQQYRDLAGDVQNIRGPGTEYIDEQREAIRGLQDEAKRARALGMESRAQDIESRQRYIEALDPLQRRARGEDLMAFLAGDIERQKGVDELLSMQAAAGVSPAAQRAAMMQASGLGQDIAGSVALAAQQEQAAAAKAYQEALGALRTSDQASRERDLAMWTQAGRDIETGQRGLATEGDIFVQQWEPEIEKAKLAQGYIEAGQRAKADWLNRAGQQAQIAASRKWQDSATGGVGTGPGGTPYGVGGRQQRTTEGGMLTKGGIRSGAPAADLDRLLNAIPGAGEFQGTTDASLQDLLWTHAIENSRNPDGTPNLEKARGLMANYQNTNRQNRIRSIQSGIANVGPYEGMSETAVLSEAAALYGKDSPQYQSAVAGLQDRANKRKAWVAKEKGWEGSPYAQYYDPEFKPKYDTAGQPIIAPTPTETPAGGYDYPEPQTPAVPTQPEDEAETMYGGRTAQRMY